MNNLANPEWPQFALHTLTLYWLTATVAVMLVAALITALARFNATTRHYIWLLTLASFVLMPLLIVAPQSDLELPQFSISTVKDTATLNTGPVDALQLSVESGTEQVIAREYNPATAAAGAIWPVARIKDASNISMTHVIKGMFVLWLAGVTFLLHLLWGEYRAARELGRQSESVTPYFERRFDQLCARLGIDERPHLRFHKGINAPITVGLLRVRVAIPMTWRETIDDSVFDQTLTHELGHIARKDPIIHTVQRHFEGRLNNAKIDPESVFVVGR